MHASPCSQLHDPQPHHLNLLASLSDSSKHRISSSRTADNPFISSHLTFRPSIPPSIPIPTPIIPGKRAKKNKKSKRGERESPLTSPLDVPNNRPRRIIPFFHPISSTLIPRFHNSGSLFPKGKIGYAHMNSTRTCVTPPREPGPLASATCLLGLGPSVERERWGRGGITSTAQHPCDLDELDGDFAGIHGRCGSSLFCFSDIGQR